MDSVGTDRVRTVLAVNLAKLWLSLCTKISYIAHGYNTCYTLHNRCKKESMLRAQQTTQLILCLQFLHVATMIIIYVCVCVFVCVCLVAFNVVNL